MSENDINKSNRLELLLKAQNSYKLSIKTLRHDVNFNIKQSIIVTLTVVELVQFGYWLLNCCLKHKE